jgi:hypothetical protein
MIWPAPEKATLLILGGTLDLPIRPPRASDALLPPLPDPASAPPETPTISRRGGVRVERIDRIGLELGTQSTYRFHVEEDAWDGANEACHREWDRSIPRDFL